MINQKNLPKLHKLINSKDFPLLKMEIQERERWEHHELMNKAIKANCKKRDDIPVLITKENNSEEQYVIMPFMFWLALIAGWKDSTDFLHKLYDKGIL